MNYSTSELGLGLGVSIKTINFPDATSDRYTKNYGRVDNELRAEAMDYHIRQPYAVLVAVVFLPIESCQDAGKAADAVSSFGAAVKTFRNRANRTGPKDQEELFERVFIGLYDHATTSADVQFFDVMDAPPRQGKPGATTLRSFSQFTEEVTATYDARNKPPFVWA